MNFSVAEKLKELYSKSVPLPKRRTERNSNQHMVSRHQSPRYNPTMMIQRNPLQMVYIDKSHDYCEKDTKEGSTGTKGR